MRTETLDETIVIRWRDERKGSASLADENALSVLLNHFKLPPVSAIPCAVENDTFTVHCQTDTFPCTVIVERKPQGAVQAAAWQYAEESGMARIEFKDAVLGVHFLDEDTFVPFSNLRFDPKRGFQIEDGAA